MYTKKRITYALEIYWRMKYEKKYEKDHLDVQNNLDMLFPLQMKLEARPFYFLYSHKHLNLVLNSSLFTWFYVNHEVIFP